MTEPRRVFIGYDGREPRGYQVALCSLLAHTEPEKLRVQPLLAAHLRGEGMYWRPEEIRGGVRYDVISNAPMSTEFALTRFLVPALCDFEGWAVFCDCDFLFRADVAELFAMADPTKAVQVVQHNYAPVDVRKMDNQPQAAYPRKNWSSLILWNCAHPAHKELDLEDINRVAGLKLHAFWWLADCLIGALPEQWNWLVGISPTTALRGHPSWWDQSGHLYSDHQSCFKCGESELTGEPGGPCPGDPKAVHFTTGTPDMPGHENDAFADEWREILDIGVR